MNKLFTKQSIKTTTKQLTPTILPGIFDQGIVVPEINDEIDLPQPSKVMIVFTEYLDNQKQKKLTEQDVLTIVDKGQNEYKIKQTEDYDEWMIREHPKIYNSNR